MRLWYVLLEERAPNTLAQIQRGPFEKVLQSKAERLPQILQCITRSRIACASHPAPQPKPKTVISTAGFDPYYYRKKTM